MDRQAADSLLSDVDLVPALEGPVSTARELERQLLELDIAVLLAKPPPKACCGSGCGCGGKLQLLVRSEDLPRVGEFMQREWLEAVRREGTGAGEGSLVQLQAPEGEPEGPLTCPACGFKGDLVEGACGDCGLQLE
jgi:hypothetical protein